MSVALQRFQKSTGTDRGLIISTLVGASDTPAAKMILDIAQNEHDAIISDALAHPKINEVDVKQDVRFKLGEASGLKKLLDAVSAVSEMAKQES